MGKLSEVLAGLLEHAQLHPPEAEGRAAGLRLRGRGLRGAGGRASDAAAVDRAELQFRPGNKE